MSNTYILAGFHILLFDIDYDSTADEAITNHNSDTEEEPSTSAPQQVHNDHYLVNLENGKYIMLIVVFHFYLNRRCIQQKMYVCAQISQVYYLFVF